MPTITLTKELIQRESLTPNDAGCQKLLAVQLEQSNFTIQHLPFNDVKNLFATHGTQGPVLCFVGHTDVVPTGDIKQWQFDPFSATEQNGLLYGRGAADMKGSVASMVIAAKNFVEKTPNHQGIIAILITSDEEGKAVHGIRQVVEHFKEINQPIDLAIIGEPSSEHKLGDIIKYGRRGTLSGTLTVYGKQGHIAYPEKALNPIPLALPALDALYQIQWDTGSKDFPPTSFQISNIFAGTGANNVIPGSMEVHFNLRFSPLLTPEYIQDKIEMTLRKYDFKFDIDWHLSGLPFITDKNSKLVTASVEAIQEVCNITPELSTKGGTSDGRFIATLGADVVEIGPINETIHQINECVKVEDLNQLTIIYTKILEKILK